MLNPFSPLELERLLRKAATDGPFPRASNRLVWQEIAGKNDAERVAGLVVAGEEAARQLIPILPATLFLDYKRQGERDTFEKPLHLRRSLLTSLVLAECLEGHGRFLDPVLNLAWAICEESAWNYPAHISELPDPNFVQLDLQTGITSLLLAEVDYLLGDQLDPRLGKRIRYEVDRRAITPFLTRHDHWWLYQPPGRAANWTAVCTGGIAAAALYLEGDPARLADILDLASRSLDRYLDSFGADGGSSEGPGYWSFGFSYFTLLAQLIDQRTNGCLNFFKEPQVEQAARFPLRTGLSPQIYLNFSDCDRDVSLIGSHLAFLARRLDIPQLKGLIPVTDAAWNNNLAWALRSLCWYEKPRAGGQFQAIPAKQDWFPDLQWMIARQNPNDPEGLVLAAKGGHNGEMHNQNDVGSFIVHYKRESLIAELGRGRYTRAYFGPERYTHFVTSSLGHSVPLINGLAQLPGRSHRASLLEHLSNSEKDLLSIEMKETYPAEAGLESLKRTVCLYRNEGRVELLDEAVFSAASGKLESVLLTFRQVNIGLDAIEIKGEKASLRLDYNPAVLKASLAVVKDVDLATGPINVNRLIFTPIHPEKTSAVRLSIQPTA